MKFELSKETAVEKTYQLAGRVIEPGLFTKICYGTTGATTATTFLTNEPGFAVLSVFLGIISSGVTWGISRTTRECLDMEIKESRKEFKRKNRKNIAKDGNRDLVNQRYVRSHNGYWQTSQPFGASHESKIIAFRESGKLQFEKIITELPHTTWDHAFKQLAKEDEIVFESDLRPGMNWKDRKKELGMLPTNF